MSVTTIRKTQGNLKEKNIVYECHLFEHFDLSFRYLHDVSAHFLTKQNINILLIEKITGLIYLEPKHHELNIEYDRHA